MPHITILAPTARQVRHAERAQEIYSGLRRSEVSFRDVQINRRSRPSPGGGQGDVKRLGGLRHEWQISPFKLMGSERAGYRAKAKKAMPSTCDAVNLTDWCGPCAAQLLHPRGQS